MENNLADDLSLQELSFAPCTRRCLVAEMGTGIEDGEVLEAVKVHTTGAADVAACPDSTWQIILNPEGPILVP